MISGGNATVYVRNMDKAVKFYTDVLGLKLDQRFGDDWAEVKAPDGFVIGIHPLRQGDSRHPPGTPGSIQIGLNIHGKLESEMEALRGKGVQFQGNIVDGPDSPVRFAFFQDPEGNELYLCEAKE